VSPVSVKPIIFHPDATAELRAAVGYYEQQRPGLGKDLQREVERAIDVRRVVSG